ncbi:nicotinate-nucleotide adenylyltransferase [Salirhabdus euzebyi]|uniref:Probable nicotinate-nucleotide adenylyltransferase n=1 Tax=Salirhabdus euzebyi TaxID=394506 RepID=A0A841Q7G7_9BACI|nr:nicotinate-nucleotide adenylyltransferase [Salirhabdus euzebyi]MBB6454346.1 nicotinate-nucleotide adenylyltransferase [Salirhabdus euzebyi]
MKKIGLLGGTFDPPHIGHLIMAEEVCEKLQLDEVWFIPVNVPPHKEASTTHGEHRLEMVKRAIEGNKHFKLEPIELKRKGISYTVDTVKQLKDKHPKHTFYFIIGADMVEYLPKWHQIKELVQLVQFVGVNRTGYKVKSDFNVIEVPIPFVDISSSQIRDRVGEKITTKYWLPDSVRRYIREQDLYGKK